MTATYRDADLFLAHIRQYGGADVPGVPELRIIWERDVHDRIEPGVRVHGDRLFPGRFSAYYTDRAEAAALLFGAYREVLQRTYPRARFDATPVERFLSLGVGPQYTRNAAIGLDARPDPTKSRIKVGFGGQVPFPERVARELLPYTTVNGDVRIERLLKRLWIVNFDVGFDGVSEAKLYFGYPRDEYDDPLLGDLLGDFQDHRAGSMCFLQYARGEWAFHYTSSARRVRERVAPCSGLHLDTRDFYSIGARTADLRSGRPLESYNLYSFYRPGERPPMAEA